MVFGKRCEKMTSLNKIRSASYLMNKTTRWRQLSVDGEKYFDKAKKSVPRSITDDNLRVIKNNTWARVDMQFLFRVLTR